MVAAEEAEVTSKTVDDKLKEPNPNTKRLLGTEGNFGEAMGLTADWGYRIIKNVRQLRRGVRAQPWRILEAEDQAWRERALDQERLAVRVSDPLIERAVGCHDAHDAPAVTRMMRLS